MANVQKMHNDIERSSENDRRRLESQIQLLEHQRFVVFSRVSLSFRAEAEDAIQSGYASAVERGEAKCSADYAAARG
jgi:hypothetical protein